MSKMSEGEFASACYALLLSQKFALDKEANEAIDNLLACAPEIIKRSGRKMFSEVVEKM